MQLLIAQQVYSIWKLADGDDWGWNLNPREVRIDFFFPSCNDTRVLLRLFAKILLEIELCALNAQACSWGLLVFSMQRERGCLLPEVIYVHKDALWTTFIVHWGDFWCLVAAACPLCKGNGRVSVRSDPWLWKSIYAQCRCQCSHASK